jgi:hypothetical protein
VSFKTVSLALSDKDCCRRKQLQCKVPTHLPHRRTCSSDSLEQVDPVEAVQAEQSFQRDVPFPDMHCAQDRDP